MSIEYYVEGKTTIQTEGSNLTFTQEDISFNSEKNVNHKGTDTGVSFNKPTEIHSADKPVNTIDVSLNLFFDGTQNNKSNTEARNENSLNHKDYLDNGNDFDDSYENDYSNVARAFDAINPNAVNQVRVYIEGIGTTDLESDTILNGVSLGTGDTGIEAKVIKGCQVGADTLGKIYTRKKINILKVNVYGFSRGAASARYFVHVATSPALRKPGFDEAVNTTFNSEFAYIVPPIKVKNGEKKVKRHNNLVENYGYFGACLAFNELEINTIIFNFAGLFDTVASHGPNHRGKKIKNTWVIGNDTVELGLDAIGKGKVYFALQIAADDEYRDNFDLTNINSTGLFGLEVTLPGVHADIGGSYIDGAKEISVPYAKPMESPNSLVFEKQKIREESEKFKQILIDEGWFSDGELEVKNFTQKQVENKSFTDKLLVANFFTGLVGTRKTVYSKYDKIPLNTVFHYSKQFGVEYIDVKLERNYGINDVFVKKVYSQLLNYMNSCNDIRSKYVNEFNDGKDPSANNYIKEIKSKSYLDFINIEDLKTLRNQYLHWSAKPNRFGYNINGNSFEPKVEGAATEKYRKRNIQDG